MQETKSNEPGIPLNVEFEAKFINVDIPTFFNTLQRLGSETIKPRTLMRRATFDIPGAQRGTFMRVRDEGDKITMTYKSLVSQSVSGMNEIEIDVSSFQAARQILVLAGLSEATYEENYREAYRLSNTQITIDEWPGLPKFIEIEGPTEKDVRTTIDLLGLSINDALFGNVDIVYQTVLSKDISGLKQITFNDPPS